ncbi:MAG: hypothetical protein MUD12_14755 [Spirochaetes bacterium]|jgi:hypothetical protein|nr:hypothetical protein [Spirochaetota bacterium]
MDIETVLGIKWHAASSWEVLLILFSIFMLAIIYFLYKYLQVLKDRRIHDHQLFLFKLKKLGLSNFQIKIINNMLGILRLGESNRFLTETALFEDGVGRFLGFLKDKNEPEETLESICKDISMINDRLFHHSLQRKPIERLMDIEADQILYFITEYKYVYMGKIISKSEKGLDIRLFRSPRQISDLSPGISIKVYIWRSGDAEYVFSSKTLAGKKNILTISISDDFVRGKEFRHPYIDIIVPATLTAIKESGNAEEEIISGTILKINEFEAVMKLSKKLNYNFDYYIDFEILEFHIRSNSRLIASRSVEEENSIYYTLKFDDMSEAAKNILKKYIYEHL